MDTADFPVLAVYGDFIRAAVDKAEAKVTGPQPVSEPMWPIWDPASAPLAENENPAG